MSVSSIYYNPFILDTARSAWQDTESSLPKKIVKSIAGATYDLYVQNPYRLTVGNLKTVINNPQAYSTKAKVGIVALAAFSSLYTCMLYGVSIYCGGKALIALGTANGSPLIAKVGGFTKLFGEKVFVTGAVPIYGLFYALPKQIIRSIPKVIEYIAPRVSQVARWVFQNILHPIWDKALSPALRSIGRVLEKAAIAVNKLVQHIIVPLWNKVIFPALQMLHRGITYIASIASKALYKLADAIRWTVTNVISPIWNNAIFPALKATGRAIYSIAKFSFEQVIKPLAEATAQAASFVFQKILVPTAKFLGNYVLKPIGTCLVAIVKKAANATAFLFNTIVAPAAKVVASACSALASKVNIVKTEIWNTMTATAQKIFGRFA